MGIPPRQQSCHGLGMSEANIHSIPAPAALRQRVLRLLVQDKMTHRICGVEMEEWAGARGYWRDWR